MPIVELVASLRLVLGSMSTRPPVLLRVRICPLRVAFALHMHRVTGAELMNETDVMLGRASSALIVIPLLRMMPNILLGSFVRP